MLLYQGRDTKVVDERPFRLIEHFIREAPEKIRPTFEQLKQAFKRQLFILLLNEEKAINALPKLLPEMDLRLRALELVRRIATASAGKLNDSQEKRFRQMEKILGVAEQGVTAPEPEKNRRPVRMQRSKQAPVSA